MGQRLNLEIVGNTGVLANAYYHWSGYTSSSLEITKEALEKFEDCKHSSLSKYEMAFDMLENTDAHFTENELEAWKKTYRDSKMRNCEMANRYTGLISYTTTGINDTRCIAKERVQIDIDKKTINFDVFFKYSAEEVKELEEDEGFSIKKLPIINFDFENIKFSKFEEFRKLIENLINNDQFYFIHNDKVYSIIE